MIIDCHYHLEERLLSREELLQQMDEAGVEKAAFMGAVVHPFPDPGMRRLLLAKISPPSPASAEAADSVRGEFVSSGAVSGNEGSGIEGEGRKSAVVAEADLCGEQVSAEKDAGSAEAVGVFDDGEIVHRTIETARDLPEERPPDEGRGIFGALSPFQPLDAPTESLEGLLRAGRQRMDPLLRHGDFKEEFSPGGDHFPGQTDDLSCRILRIEDHPVSMGNRTDRRISAADGLVGRLFRRPKRPEEPIVRRDRGDQLPFPGSEDAAEEPIIPAFPDIFRILQIDDVVTHARQSTHPPCRPAVR